MLRRFGRPSPATTIACLALFFAIAGGSAIALQGRNSVDSGDIKPKAVKTSDIANNAVTTRKIRNNHVRAADIQNNAVGTGEIRNGQVSAPDFAQQEAYRVVGQAGQPVFNVGAEGDCIWTNAPVGTLPINPASFYKDALGRVQLAGAVQSVPGPGGDTTCGGAGAEPIEDLFAFALPAGYRPANPEFRGSNAGGAGPILIVGTTPVLTADGPLTPGGVYDLTGSGALLIDGLDFRAAGTGSGFGRRAPLQLDALPQSVAELFDAD